MISAVTIQAGGKTQVLRLTTRAMMRLEDAFDLPVDQVFSQLSENPKVGTLVTILATMMADGKGAERDDAADLIDEIGFEVAGKAIEDAATKAFPDTVGKNSKGARPAPKK